jgi:outer membrane protein assembly factor BamB
MANPISSDSPNYRPLRIWIPAVLIILMVAARYFSVWFPEMPMVWMVGAFVPALLGLLILLWWLTLSRANWTERLIGLVGVIAAIATAVYLMDKTMLGPPIVVLTMPTTIAAFAVTLILTSGMLTFRRTLLAILCSFLVAGCSALLKNDGARGDFSFGFDWRWKPTPEEVFLTSRAASTKTETIGQPTTESFSNPTWPGFRGPRRDGVQRGLVFESDWNKFPPKELWRFKLGPAWSSFAVANKFLVTQEQRGEQEAIVCYDADTGKEVWAQAIKSRFFDALGGLGPRATPMIASGSVYAMGAEGWLVKLNAVDGTIQWKADLRELTKQELPMWGFSCSPLVVDELVIVHAAGQTADGVVAAFETATGKLKWSVPADKDSYSSLHLANYFDKQQLVFLGAHGATFLEPATGKTLLNYEFKIMGYRALQPAVVDSNRMLFTSEYSGSRLIELESTDTGLAAKEVWTSRNIKPDFNDLVVHEGFAYGFDGAIFSCIDLKDGSRRWKKGRYGKGQVMLLADSALLLVISESGELVLLSANPKEHRELAKLKALEGKTWNHPVVVDDRLYLRNAEEAVCYQLPQVSESADSNTTAED